MITILKKNQFPVPIQMVTRQILLILICLALTFPSAMAFDHGNDSTKTNFRGISNLTAAQKTKIKEINIQLKKEILPLKNAIGEKMARIKTLETAEKTDLTAIHATIDDLQGLRSKMLKLRATHKQEIRKILTTEQRLEFDLGSRHKGNRGKGRGRHKGHGRH